MTVTTSRLLELAKSPRDEDGFPTVPMTDEESAAVQDFDSLEGSERYFPTDVDPLDAMSHYLSNCVDDADGLWKTDLNAMTVIWESARQALELAREVLASIEKIPVDEPGLTSLALFTLGRLAGLAHGTTADIASARAVADEAAAEEALS